jgi:uncharacterized metal-binding protein
VVIKWQFLKQKGKAPGKEVLMSDNFSCTSCGVFNCASQSGTYPGKCLTTSEENEEILEECLDIYNNDPEIHKIAVAAAQVEGQYYGQLTRVEEIIVFAKKIQAKKIGIASCMGLIQESKIFEKVLKANGFEPYGVICKVGAKDKSALGVSEEDKIRPGHHESACNPIMQAKILNRENTDLNVICGLCVGHDSMFIKHSDAPVTYLVVKDRVLAHNPVGALYTNGSYYKRILQGVNLREEDKEL